MLELSDLGQRFGADVLLSKLPEYGSAGELEEGRAEAAAV